MKKQDLHGDWFETDDLPADPLEITDAPSETAVRLTRAKIVERGGRMIPGRHEDRHTVFKIKQNGETVKRNADLAACAHEAMFAIAPKDGGRMITGCVECDAADTWPRFEDVA